MKRSVFAFLFVLFTLQSSISFSANNCQAIKNLEFFVNANPILNGLVERYKGDPVTKDFSNIFESGLRQLFEMSPIFPPEYTNIQKDGKLVTIDFRLNWGESGLLGRISLYYKDQILTVTVPSVKALTPGDTYFPKFISGFYEGIHRVIGETSQPVVDIHIKGGIVVNRKLKQRLPKLGFTQKGMNYSIITSEYSD